jgi:hypothetical protein
MNPNNTRVDSIILALLQSPSIEKAAASLDLAPSTLWRWLKKPKFKEALRDARRKAFSQSIARLQNASSAAVSTLLKTMVDTGAPHASRIRAAECVLEMSLRSMETEDLEARIDKLEQTRR